MVSVRERRKHARSKDPAGNVSRHAQRRVDERVRDVMARRDAAQQRDSHSDQPLSSVSSASAHPRHGKQRDAALARGSVRRGA
jgi:hypothetical protein